jgi:hypothetical protein
MFRSINKDNISLSIRNGLYMPFMYKGQQVVVHNAAWSFREKVWIDDELVVNEIGLRMASTHVLEVAGDEMELTFGYRDNMKVIFLEARVDGELIHEVSEQAGKEVRPSSLAITLILSGLAGILVGYLIGSLLGGS